MPTPEGDGDHFVWLLGTAPVPGQAPSEAAFKLACDFAADCWQMLPVTLPRLRQWAGDAHAGHAALAALNDLAISVRTLASVQFALGRRFVEELDRRRIPHALLKGMAARVCIYPTVDSRGCLDVDVAVPRPYLPAAVEVALDQGHVAASLDESRRHFFVVGDLERALVEANHYELACRVRRQVVRGLPQDVVAAIRRSIPFLRPWHLDESDDPVCYVALDIHHGLCLDIDVDEVVDSRIPATADGLRTWVPRPEWMAFHLIFKLYWEGVHNYRKGGYQFADMVRLAPSLRGPTAAALIRLLERYSLEAGGYYVLRRLHSPFGVRLDPQLDAFLERSGVPPHDRFPEEANDLGDMWPKVWGFR
jgi:Uncharacterised nucleotidyltransferase